MIPTIQRRRAGGRTQPAALGSSGFKSTVTTDADEIAADGDTPATITVTLLDVEGNPVAGVVPTMAATGSGNTLGTFPATDADGVTEAEFKTTGATAHVITITAQGRALSDTVTVTGTNSGTPPVLTSVSPDWEYADTPQDDVVLTGTNFVANGLAVTVNGVSCTNVTYVSPTEVTVTVPAGTVFGPVDVVITTDFGSDTLTDGYAYHPAPISGWATHIDARPGKAHYPGNALTRSAALTAMGFSTSVTEVTTSTLEWDRANVLGVPNFSGGVFLLKWRADGTHEQQLMITKGMSIAAGKDMWFSEERFQEAGFDNDQPTGSGGNFGRKQGITFLNDTPQVRIARTMNGSGRVRIFRDGNAYSGDPTTAGDDGSRAEARWAGSGGSSNGGTVPAPSIRSVHPNDVTGIRSAWAHRWRPESSAGAGDGEIETYHNGRPCDLATGMYTSPYGCGSELQISNTWNRPTISLSQEALYNLLAISKDIP